jgi:thymidylate synthase (FAD)
MIDLVDRLVWGPSVFLVGASAVDEYGIRQFLDSEGMAPEDDQQLVYNPDAENDGEALIELAARLCYMSFQKPRPGGIRAFLDNIIASGHGSVLEHATFNFIITGVSRSFSHELVRHRVGFSYSQLSQRYVDEDTIRFVVPSVLADGVRLADAVLKGSTSIPYPSEEIAAGAGWLQSVRYALDAYIHQSDYLNTKFNHIEDKTLRRKRAREAAREVLPNATETKIFVTANARSIRHFVELRSAEAADRQIRAVAGLVFDLTRRESPNVFADYVTIDTGDGLRAHTTPHRKV